MSTESKARVVIVIPVGPGKEAVLDTLDSVEFYCPEPHRVILVDDQTRDGTYEALRGSLRPHWELIRNERQNGWQRIVHTLCLGYEQAVTTTECELIFKLDVDALLIKPGLLQEALEFSRSNPAVGMFGVYAVDYNRPRDFDAHKALFASEGAWWRALLGLRPPWYPFLGLAEDKGYQRGENVFGGGYFITRQCAVAMRELGAFRIPRHWRSRIAEDVYFSMLTLAAGFRLGHFAAPDGPLCMEWRGLPLPASVLAGSKFKVVHSVDRGPNTGPAENDGKTAREVFRRLRRKA